MNLGIGANEGNKVSWFRVSPPIILEPGGGIGELAAETTGRALTEDDTAWVEIKTPDYNGGEIATEGYDTFQRVAKMAGPVLANTINPIGSNKYEVKWNQDDLTPYIKEFDTPGTYKVYYFLKDGETRRTGAYLVTNIYVKKSANHPPEPVELDYPDDNACVFTSAFFAWNRTADSDGDPVTYRLEVSPNPAFPAEYTIIKDGITGRVTQIEGTQELRDLTQYYWRVVPVDPYGAIPEHNTIRTFTTDNGNPAIPGAIVGSVMAVETDAGIAGARVQLGTQNINCQSDGSFFIGQVSAGTYAVIVSADGYLTATHVVNVSVGGLTGRDFFLQAELKPAEGEGEVHGEGENEGEVHAEGETGNEGEAANEGETQAEGEAGNEGEVPVEGEIPPPDTIEEAAQALFDGFDAADTDASGGLSETEAMAALPGLTRDQFVELDANGDGELTREELEMILDPGCGCCRKGSKGLTPKEMFYRTLGDWLLLGLVLLALINFKKYW